MIIISWRQFSNRISQSTAGAKQRMEHRMSESQIALPEFRHKIYRLSFSPRVIEPVHAYPGKLINAQILSQFQKMPRLHLSFSTRFRLSTPTPFKYENAHVTSMTLINPY